MKTMLCNFKFLAVVFNSFPIIWVLWQIPVCLLKEDIREKESKKDRELLSTTLNPGFWCWLALIHSDVSSLFSYNARMKRCFINSLSAFLCGKTSFLIQKGRKAYLSWYSRCGTVKAGVTCRCKYSELFRHDQNQKGHSNQSSPSHYQSKSREKTSPGWYSLVSTPIGSCYVCFSRSARSKKNWHVLSFFQESWRWRE